MKTFHDIDIIGDIQGCGSESPFTQREFARLFSQLPSLVHWSLVIGHYWLDCTPDLLQPNLVCLDYNIDITGGICAYRLNNTDFKLSRENIVIGVK